VFALEESLQVTTNRDFSKFRDSFPLANHLFSMHCQWLLTCTGCRFSRWRLSGLSNHADHASASMKMASLGEAHLTGFSWLEPIAR
jgi:hypothetical protein